MNNRWVDISRLGKNSLMVASALALSVQLVPGNLALAASSSKKSSSMQIPINEKLEELGRVTNERLSKESPKADLTPLKLGAKAEPDTTSGAGDDVLKSTVTETDFVPKGLVGGKGTATPPVSIKEPPSSIEEKVIKDAKKTNIMPLALMESRDEADRKLEAKNDAEKEQLTDLWNATLTRSPDIQFVTQKLLPTSNPGHTTAVMMKFLQSAMFGAAGAAAMMSPNMGTMAMSQMGANMISQVLGMTEANAAKKARLSQTETIMLYTIVRNTADHVVDNYRNYKKTINTLKVAETDLADLQNMVRDIRESQDAAKQIEMSYTLKKAQRDITSITDEARKYRQSLMDLAGSDAIAKLDTQIEQEQLAIDPALAQAESAALREAEAAAATGTDAAQPAVAERQPGIPISADPKAAPNN